MLLSLPDHDRVSFLQDLVYRDEGFERLDFVGKDRLSIARWPLALRVSSTPLLFES